ncbi:putative membrane protein YphA (DoxX/SURF4 family) [Rhodococcus sp. 27YEA15]
MGRNRFSALVAPVFAGATRVALGALWLHEGLVKYRAHFGRADILLVVDSTSTNTRVPDLYKIFTTDVLGTMPGPFGIVVPAVETGLGIALVVGVFTRATATISALALCTYWLADQLTGQYPTMTALSVLVILWPIPSSTLSLPTLLGRRRRAPYSGSACSRRRAESRRHGLERSGWHRRRPNVRGRGPVADPAGTPRESAARTEAVSSSHPYPCLHTCGDE